MWIDIGSQDLLGPAATELGIELLADGADVSFHVWPGNHKAATGDAHFADYLRFYADACS